MKFFIDTANLEEIRKAEDMGMMDGVTTNPSLLLKEGKEPTKLIRDIAHAVKGAVSAEAVSSTFNDLTTEALQLSSINYNIVVKIPLTIEGLKAIKYCSTHGIKTNATLVFSPTQALLAAKAGATYVSPFVGRLDDAGRSGMELIKEILTVYDNYKFSTQVIVASIRSVYHVRKSAQLGAHIATIPFNVIEQLSHHELTDKGIEKFNADWEKLQGVLK